MSTFEPLFQQVKCFVVDRGVDVRSRNMELEKPGEFDGPTITINPKHDLEALCYYLAHSFGSICQWSIDFGHAQKVFDALRDAKKSGSGFEEALEQWRGFEEKSSEHAVWVLEEVGHAEAVWPYSVFFRADLEAMTEFHRTGKEPPWPEFFADWKRKLESGDIRVEPFRPKPVPRFQPVRIEKQEVLQERD